ncbi:MAG: ArsR/SmtB family transcription factor [Longimicrobiales bacterium]
MPPQTNLQVIDAPDTAAAVLNPVRLNILAQLVQPGSSTTVGKALGLPRQKVDYHVRELERRGLVTEVGTRQRHGCTERLLQSRARSLVVDPAALGPVQIDPGQLKDQFSSAYLIASASKTIRDVATLRRGADQAGKKLATFTIETEVTFRDPKDQAGFLDELSNAVAALAAKYHINETERGRSYRFAVAGHPTVPTPEA